MPYTVTTAPSDEPVSLADAKLHCSVDSSDEDTLLAALITAGRETVEQITGRALITQTRLLLTEVGQEDIELPGPPLQSVVSVQTVDEPQDAVAATSAIGSGSNGTVTLTAATAGVAGNALTIEVEIAAGNNDPLAVAQAGDDITVTLGTDAMGAADPAKNTAALVAAALGGLTSVTAAASGTGATALSSAEGPHTFTGGYATLTSLTLGTDYDLVLSGSVPRIRILKMPGDAELIRISYTCGYGDAATDVPQALRQAILLLLGHWYAQRETAADVAQREVPWAATALCQLYRTQWFGGRV
jgi:uncharacterized phiE125 gp8 family phage protein